MKPKKKSVKSKLEESFFDELRVYAIPLPVRQYKFHPEHKWTLDFFWPQWNVAVEVQGGLFMRKGGGHSSGAAIEDDHEKLNFAQRRGIAVFQFGPKALYRKKRTNAPSEALAFIWTIFKGDGVPPFTMPVPEGSPADAEIAERYPRQQSLAGMQ